MATMDYETENGRYEGEDSFSALLQASLSMYLTTNAVTNSGTRRGTALRA